MNQPRRIKADPPPAASPGVFRRAQDSGWEMAVYGDLTDKQSELVGRLVEIPRNSRGVIYFDSCGGSAYVGLALASLIRLRGLDVTGVVASECSSASILPLAACRRRFVTPHSTLLFHPVRWQSEENVSLEEASEWARHFKVMEQDLDGLLSRMFDYPIEKLTEWTRPGRFVTGTEFAEAGLAKLIDLFSGTLWQQIARVDSGQSS